MRKTKRYKRKKRLTRKKGGSIKSIMNKAIQSRQMVSNKLNQSSQMAYDKMKNNIENIFKTPYIKQFIQKIKEKKTETEYYIKSINSSLNLDPNMIQQNQAILEFVQKNNALLIKILKSDKLRLDILTSGNEADIQKMILIILFEHKSEVLNPIFLKSVYDLSTKLNNY